MGEHSLDQDKGGISDVIDPVVIETVLQSVEQSPERCMELLWVNQIVLQKLDDADD